MADKIVSQDPTKPGVLKLNGPTLSATNQVPVSGLDPAGAIDGNVIVRTAGQWTAGTGGISSDTASNLGAGSQVFKSKVGGDFQFRSLIAGTGVTVTQNANDISIATTSVSAVVMLADQKAQNTPGGTFTLGAWRTRDLNTELADPDGLATIAANQITLAAGTYRTLIIAPAYKVGDHAARLQNITDATTILVGTSQTNGTADAVTNHSTIVGRFTLAVAKVLEVQHQSASTGTTTGFGVQANFQTEQYTTVIFWKE